jgi:hypothetical protein
LAFVLSALMASPASAEEAPAPADSAPAPAAQPAPAPAPVAVPAATPDAGPGEAPKLFSSLPLLTKEYGFGVVGQAVAGALGFYIGSGIETAIVGDEDAHKGWLSFTGIRYDNFYGAFWGGVTGGLMGSAMTTYFIGQTEEDDGSLFWTIAGAAAAGAGAMYIASEMGVNESRDWKPFIPLLALPSVGGVVGFNVSRWFSDKKRARIVGPESASLHWQPPRLAVGPDGMAIQALNFTF